MRIDRIDDVRRRLCVATGLGAATASLAAAAPEPGVGADRLLIGQTITLQGGQNAYGTAVRAGMSLLFDEINAAGGIHGRRIEVTTLDDDNRADRAEANARRLVAEGCFLLFGPIEGGPSTAVAKVATETRVPLFGPMAGSPTLRRPHLPMVFPVRAEHRSEFAALLRWAKSTGLRRLAFFHSDTEVGQQHLANISRIAAELGIERVAALPTGGQLTDAQLDAMVGQLRSSAADVVVNHGSIGLYQRLIVRSRQAGLGTTFMGVNSGSSQLAAALGPLAAGMVFAQVMPSPIERKQAIARDYQDSARRADPQAALSYGGLEGYLTARALALVLRANGRALTRASLIRTLYAQTFDLGGMRFRYAPGDHEGSSYVDLSMVARDGHFIH